MKNQIWLLWLLILFFQQKPATAQTDAPETLQWVEIQAKRIDTLMENAILSYDQVDLIFRMTDVFLIFDAIALAGVYCPEIRQAAQMGRNHTDVVNYRLEKDMNSNVVRATLARVEADKMRQAAQNCRIQTSTMPEKPFSPADVIREEVHLVELLLSDGLAVDDFHILSQKLEQTIRVLHDIEHLASTFKNCEPAARSAAKAIQYCENALAARNWMEAKNAVSKALTESKTIPAATCNE